MFKRLFQKYLPGDRVLYRGAKVIVIDSMRSKDKRNPRSQYEIMYEDSLLTEEFCDSRAFILREKERLGLLKSLMQDRGRKLTDMNYIKQNWSKLRNNMPTNTRGFLKSRAGTLPQYMRPEARKRIKTVNNYISYSGGDDDLLDLFTLLFYVDNYPNFLALLQMPMDLAAPANILYEQVFNSSDVPMDINPSNVDSIPSLIDPPSDSVLIPDSVAVPDSTPSESTPDNSNYDSGSSSSYDSGSSSSYDSGSSDSGSSSSSD